MIKVTIQDRNGFVTRNGSHSSPNIGQNAATAESRTSQSSRKRWSMNGKRKQELGIRN